jgi:hypothetical protein
MVAALDAGAFKSARSAFAKLAARDDVANWARVAAARAIEDGSADGDAPLLVREALAQLAATRELGALRALVERYGEGILGTDGAGFVPRYVRAVRLYDESQKAIAAAGEDEEKLKSEDVRGPSRAAAEALGAALAAEDAAGFADAAVACRLMRAWSLRGAGSFVEGDGDGEDHADADEGAVGQAAGDAAVVEADEAAQLGEAAARATPLRPGDRVELLRPLCADPKDARRRRARDNPLPPTRPRPKRRRAAA